jgi:hypothetical protein
MKYLLSFLCVLGGALFMVMLYIWLTMPPKVPKRTASKYKLDNKDPL